MTAARMARSTVPAPTLRPNEAGHDGAPGGGIRSLELLPRARRGELEQGRPGARRISPDTRDLPHRSVLGWDGGEGGSSRTVPWASGSLDRSMLLSTPAGSGRAAGGGIGRGVGVLSGSDSRGGAGSSPRRAPGAFSGRSKRV